MIGAAADVYSNDQQIGAANKRNQQNAWIGNAQQDLLSRSKAVADRPYTPYTGTRVAGQSANEQQANQMASNAATFNDSRGYLDKAGSTIDGVSSWSTDTLNKYMNPYVGQVVDNSLKRENTAYQQSQNELKGKAASMGAFGGDRATLLESQNLGQHLQTVGDITSKGYSDAYGQALNAWQADTKTKLASADAYRAVGGDISRLNSSQITDLLKTGQGDTLMRQMQLDVNYKDFVEQRDWSANNLQPLFKAVGEATGGKQEAVPADTTATTIAGLASTLVGYFGGNASSAPKATGGTGAGMGTATPINYGSGIDGSGGGSVMLG